MNSDATTGRDVWDMTRRQRLGTKCECPYAKCETLEARRVESGGWVLGKEAAWPSPPVKRVYRERCKLPQQGPGRSPVKFWIWCILGLENRVLQSCIKTVKVKVK